MHPTEYYRLPWTLTDNVLSWLEPTKKCNIYCEGCYSTNEPNSHKSMDQLRQEMKTFVSLRKVDSVSIAGGDPLTYPHVVDLVRMVKDEFGLKPVVNTNGHAMTPQLLRDLKKAGMHGVTFHVDSSQSRPGWKKMTNLELNPLRLQLARMVDDEGGLTCSFNSTVFRDTMHEVPAMVRWAQEHIDIVHSMVFILFRTARSEEFAYMAGDRRVKIDELAYYDQENNPKPLMTPELFELIQKEEPDFDAAAYLGGTRDADTFKWTLVGRIGSPEKIYGYVGPRFMETVQTAHHAATGRYLAYSHPSLLRQGRATMTAFSAVDPRMRTATRRWLSDFAHSPRRAARKQYFQSIAFIQPIDMTPEGEANMCDGCPDMTVHEGKLVWSCRLDELKRHGTFLACVPLAKMTPAPVAEG